MALAVPLLSRGGYLVVVFFARALPRRSELVLLVSGLLADFPGFFLCSVVAPWARRAWEAGVLHGVPCSCSGRLGERGSFPCLPQDKSS